MIEPSGSRREESFGANVYPGASTQSQKTGPSKASASAVSYTHLTLPTILLV